VHPTCQTQRIELALKPIPQVDSQGVQTQDAEGMGSLTLRALFDTEESSLLRYAFSLTGRRAVAEEIVQDVFLQLHSRFSEVDSPRAWLFRSVRNRAYNHRRDNQREILVCDDPSAQTTDVKAAAPEALLLKGEAAAQLRVIVEELSAADRQLVELKYFENLKYRDISAQTGLSISNVGYRLHHILKGLAKKLRQLGIDSMS